MQIVDELLRIEATLVAVNVGSPEAEIVLRMPMPNEGVARLVQQVGGQCMVGLYFQTGRRKNLPEAG
jgi:hypothetical protein